MEKVKKLILMIFSLILLLFTVLMPAFADQTPNALINNVEKKPVMDLVVNDFVSNKGFMVLSANDYQVTVYKKVEGFGTNFMLRLLDGGADSQMRLQFNFVQAGSNVAVSALGDLVGNPGTNYEKHTTLTGVDLQAYLNNLKAYYNH